MKYIQSFEAVNEAKRGVVHKAAKKGSYPAVVVVVQDGKVIHQEPVATPDIAPATFNVMQEKYPKALLHLEDNTGKRLFSESVVTEAMDLNDPVLVAFRRTRAIMELPKFKSAEVKSRRISFDKYMDLLDSQADINQDIKDKAEEMAQTLRDMEQEAEPEGGAIADKYGSIMMKQEKEYAQLKAKKAKIDARIEKYKMS
jgi:hypothetical protein